MEAYRSWIVLISLFLYGMVCLGVGVWALGRIRSTRDFFMAGRRLGIFVTGLAVFSMAAIRLLGWDFFSDPQLLASTAIDQRFFLFLLWRSRANPLIKSGLSWAIAYFVFNP